MRRKSRLRIGTSSPVREAKRACKTINSFSRKKPWQRSFDAIHVKLEYANSSACWVVWHERLRFPLPREKLLLPPLGSPIYQRCLALSVFLQSSFARTFYPESPPVWPGQRLVAMSFTSKPSNFQKVKS